MNTVEYYTGITTRTVTSIEDLVNPSMELAESIATGPQDEFFETLDRFNGRFRNEYKLSVTPSWNWKPGSIPKVKQHIIDNILEISKKPNGLTSLFQRTKDRTWYLDRWLADVRVLENLKYNLKVQNFKPNVNLEEFKTSMEKFVEEINNQIKAVTEMTNNKISINMYVQGLDNPRYSNVYIDIRLQDLKMDVFNGNKIIHNHQLYPIHIVAKTSFRKFLTNYIDKKNTYHLFTFKGMYLSKLLSIASLSNRGRTMMSHLTEEYFPYIAKPKYGSNHDFPIYSTVCLDKYQDEIQASLGKLDWINTAMSLMSWAQYFNTEYSNPYNTITQLHLGISEDYSTEYKALYGYETMCNDVIKTKFKIRNITHDENYYDSVKSANMHCDSLKCVFRDNRCPGYKDRQVMIEIAKDEEYKFKVESFLGYLIYELGILNENNDKYFIEDWFNFYDTIDDNYESNLFSYLSHFQYENTMIKFLDSNTNYGKEINKQPPSTDEEAKAEILRWATGGQ